MKKTLLSLIIPVINTVAFSLFAFLQPEYALCPLICGILPIILTLKFGIDTSKYIGLRFILFVLSALHILLVGYCLSCADPNGSEALQAIYRSNFILNVLYYAAPVLYLAGSSVFFHKKFGRIGERAVLLLSNPVICFIIWFIIFEYTFTLFDGF